MNHASCLRAPSLLSALGLLFVLAQLGTSGATQGTPIGFVETFALAPDRSKVLDQLVPGTVEYYYYHCLYHQQQGEFAKVPPLLQTWIERHGRSELVVQIEHRQALLTFEQDPAATFRFLQQSLSLRFDAERQDESRRPDLPTRLDPQLLQPGALTAKALALHPGSLNGFRPSALPALASTDLSQDLLPELLRRLDRPDLPNLPALIARELALPRSRGFGAMPIHRLLLLDQLEQLLQLRLGLLDSPEFVQVYLRRLVPGPDSTWRRDPAQRLAYLERLQAFAQRLSPAHNSLKAHVLYHRLVHDLATNAPSRQRLLDYLRLPRQGHTVNPVYRQRNERAPQIEPGADFPTGLPPIGNDEALVTEYLQVLLRDDSGYDAYAEFVREDWLRRLFAETKILAGVGDMERWYSLLDDPAYYERLKERVEIRFPATRQQRFAVDEPVRIEVDTKNVPTLLVKVFEIDAYAFHRDRQKPIDTGIDLDGVIANRETTYSYNEPPQVRVRRSFEFPTLQQPGTYVLEFLGNGVSSRVVVQKGALQYVARSGAAGQVLRVLDEQCRPVPGASVWCGGRDYQADERGDVAVPFAAASGVQRIVLHQGRLSTLDQLERIAEQYTLTVGAFVERESLVPGQDAKVLVRPQLSVHGQPVALALLEQPQLTIAAVGHDGVATTLDVRDLKLSADQELVQTIRVPERLAKLRVVLQGKVSQLGKSEPLVLQSAPVEFEANGIDPTPLTGCPLLARTAQGYAIDVRGRNGEPKVGRPVALQLVHRDYVDAIDAVLQTDGNGRIQLGDLPGIVAVRANGFGDGQGNWTLPEAVTSLPTRLCGVAGGVLQVPLPATVTAPQRGEQVLLECCPNGYVRDRSDRLSFARGALELRGLEPNVYHLWLRRDLPMIEVQIVAGTAADGWIAGQNQLLQQPSRPPLLLEQAAVDGESLRIKLGNAGSDTRVHVVASRYLPPYALYGSLRGDEPLSAQVLGRAFAENAWHAGREIGDEYRYILDRRYAAKFPGNMLPRPGLLLNPWALTEQPTSRFDAKAGSGGAEGGRFGGRGGGGRGRPASSAGAGGPHPGAFADLGFLPAAAPLLANLVPDANGELRVPLASLGQGQLVHVLALAGGSASYTTVQLPEQPLTPRDRRLQQGLDPGKHFTQQRRIEFLAAGAAATLPVDETTQTRPFDSLGAVFQLFTTLSGDAELQQFAFVTRWPTLSDDEKRQLYSQHACHELHFFLHQKDPGFFAAVVRPYLANKLHRTFLDHWLLGDDLSGYLEPWAFHQLNLFERILLGKRLPGQQAAAARHVRELLDVLPKDPERDERLFAAALQSGALVAPDESRDAGRRLLAMEPMPETAAAGKPAAPPVPPAAAAPAPAGPTTGGPGGAPARRARASEDAQRGAEMDAAPAKDADKNLAEKEVQNELREELAKKLKDDSAGELADLERRKQVRVEYRAPDPTRAQIEHEYWHRRRADSGAGMIGASPFWLDYAEAPDGKPFFSPHFATAANSFAEMLLALSVLDLPFTGQPIRRERDGNTERLTAQSPLLLVRQELRAADGATSGSPILISQDFFRLDDRYRWEGNDRIDNFVTGEFLADVAYGCQVVLTNPSSTPRKLELLLQIPRGAIPVDRGMVTRGVPVQLAPFATQSFVYAFYFPAPGRFPHFPAHVARDGVLLASVAPVTLEVVALPSQVDTTSWARVSQDAPLPGVLAFLDGANLERLDLGKLAFRMRDKAAFTAITERLRQRLHYDHTLWSYAILHGDRRATAEFLRHQDDFVERCGLALRSPLLDIDPVVRNRYEHVEFEPLFHSRVHRIGARRVILNDGLARQYLSLLTTLAQLPKLDSRDWLAVATYLLLQDRIDEALAVLPRIQREQLPTGMQYDYLRAYLAFYTDERSVARQLAEGYRDHPVARWRQRFDEVLRQLDEADGKAVAPREGMDRQQRQGDLTATEPALDLVVVGTQVRIRHQNIASCELRYHKVDVEFSFSTSPFVQQGGGAFAYVQPARIDAVALNKDQRETVVELPAELQRGNLLVEVRGNGLVRRQLAFATAMQVQTVEQYGQLQVTQVGSGKPLPKVYVKVYARLPGGAVKFHKDGYTDLRGRFDYASVSSEATAGADRFAILVLSDQDGAVIQEAVPPGR